MTDIGYVQPTNKSVESGTPLVKMHKVETATNMKPGRLVKPGTTVADIVVNDGEESAIGWLGYQDASADVKNNTSGLDGSPSGTYAAEDHAPVLNGGHFVIKAHAYTGCGAITKGTYVFAYSANGEITTHGSHPVGIAMEDVASGGNADCLVLSKL